MIKETLELKLGLLTKPIWSVKDISAYYDCSISKARKLKIRAIKENKGEVPYGSNYVLTNSVLSLFGVDREDEIDLLKRGLNEKYK